MSPISERIATKTAKKRHPGRRKKQQQLKSGKSVKKTKLISKNRQPAEDSDTINLVNEQRSSEMPEKSSLYFDAISGNSEDVEVVEPMENAALNKKSPTVMSSNREDNSSLELVLRELHINSNCEKVKQPQIELQGLPTYKVKQFTGLEPKPSPVASRTRYRSKMKGHPVKKDVAAVENAEVEAAKERELQITAMLSPPEKSTSNYTFEMLHEDDSTDDEDDLSTKRPLPPSWSRSDQRGVSVLRQEYVPSTIIDSFFSVQPMTPDLKEIFPEIKDRHLKRRSSAVWKTPPRYSELPKY